MAQERTDAKLMLTDQTAQYKSSQMCREVKIKQTGVMVRKSAAEVPEALQSRLRYEWVNSIGTFDSTFRNNIFTTLITKARRKSVAPGPQKLQSGVSLNTEPEIRATVKAKVDHLIKCIQSITSRSGIVDLKLNFWSITASQELEQS